MWIQNPKVPRSSSCLIQFISKVSKPALQRIWPPKSEGSSNESYPNQSQHIHRTDDIIAKIRRLPKHVTLYLKSAEFPLQTIFPPKADISPSSSYCNQGPKVLQTDDVESKVGKRPKQIILYIKSPDSTYN